MAVSEVPRSDFGEERLEERLESPEWAAALAQTHFDVVEQLFARGPVLPLRMCTLFASPDRVADVLTARAAELQASLDRLAGCAEWSVKVAGRRSASAPRTADTPTSGADYLRRASTRLAEQQDAGRRAQQHAERLHARLSSVAVEVAGGGPAGGLLHRASYLVRAGDRDRFLDLVQAADEASESGVAVEVGGPWAPYSFVPRLQEAS
ncbi:MAG TPA: GvpL/GvpF family gas vesicle protein, partial [Candidatus Eisenbacteria bacterium]|nr:GvpL/GvpF family gas vesicle protein [Candidatus Eisenbacteria bacterium]